MNKILLFLSCCGLSLLSSAQTTFTVDDVTYQITGENRVGISDVVSSVTSFDIPATITNDGVAYEVKTIEKDAFKWSKATMIVLDRKSVV